MWVIDSTCIYNIAICFFKCTVGAIRTHAIFQLKKKYTLGYNTEARNSNHRAVEAAFGGNQIKNYSEILLDFAIECYTHSRYILTTRLT